MLSLLGNLFSSYMNWQSQNSTNRTNQQLAQQANDWSIAQWNRENAYNLPVNQVRRLKEAGINPAMMFANGTSSLSAAMSPEVQMSQNRAPQMQNIDPLTMSQVRLANAQADNIEARTQTENESRPAKITNLDEYGKWLMSARGAQDADVYYKYALQGESLQRANNLFQQYTQSAQKFVHELEMLKMEEHISKETAETLIETSKATLDNMREQTKFLKSHRSLLNRQREHIGFMEKNATDILYLDKREFEWQVTREMEELFQGNHKLTLLSKHYDDLNSHYLRRDWMNFGIGVLNAALRIYPSPKGATMDLAPVQRPDGSFDWKPKGATLKGAADKFNWSGRKK